MLAQLLGERRAVLVDLLAGPRAQGVFDPVIVPCPMSVGGAVIVCSILFKDYAFLGASAHKNVPLAG